MTAKCDCGRGRGCVLDPTWEPAALTTDSIADFRRLLRRSGEWKMGGKRGEKRGRKGRRVEVGCVGAGSPIG